MVRTAEKKFSVALWLFILSVFSLLDYLLLLLFYTDLLKLLDQVHIDLLDLCINFHLFIEISFVPSFNLVLPSLHELVFCAFWLRWCCLDRSFLFD